MTSGVVPDIIRVGDYFFAVTSAWNDQLVDLSDVIETQKSLFTPTALSTRPWPRSMPSMSSVSPCSTS